MHHEPAPEAAARATPGVEAGVAAGLIARVALRVALMEGRAPKVLLGRAPPGRRVTFREPEVELNSGGDVEDYSLEPPVSDVEIWLE